MTPRQTECLEYIRSYALRHKGASPSYQMIANHLGMASKSSVHRLIAALEKQRHIQRSIGGHRTIQLTSWGSSESLVCHLLKHHVAAETDEVRISVSALKLLAGSH